MPTRTQGMSSGGQTRFLSQAEWQQEAGDSYRSLRGAFTGGHIPIAHLQPKFPCFWYPGRRGAGLPAQRLTCTSREVQGDQMESLVCEKAGHAGLHRQIPIPLCSAVAKITTGHLPTAVFPFPASLATQEPPLLNTSKTLKANSSFSK